MIIIKNIFLPEKIKNYYLFSKTIAGIDISKTHIHCTLARLHGSVISIDDHFIEKIEQTNNFTYEERVILALARIKERLNKVDEIYTSFSSSLAIFKELKLPFNNYEKIKMVVNFEIEPLLPFPLDNAIIDFIITKKIAAENSAELLVAAVQKEQVNNHIQLFEQAGITVNRIIIDLFALYNVYIQIPEYQTLSGSIALIDLGMQSTRIAYIQDGQMRMIRTLPQGLSNIAKMVSESSHITVAQALEVIVRFGFTQENNHYEEHIKQAMNNFWDSINFALQSFHVQMAQNSSYSHILLLGSGSEIPLISEFATNKLHVTCHLFDPNKISSIAQVEVKNKNCLTNGSIISIGLVLPSPLLDNFNLRKDNFALADYRLLLKQLIIGSVLLIVLCITLITAFFIQTKKLNNEIITSQEESIEELKKRFKTIDPEEHDLDTALEQAQQELNKEEQTWFAFSNHARASFLQYLLELTIKIDTKSLGFVADQLIIKNDTLTLKAQVKDYDALKILERELKQSKLFRDISPLQDPIFTLHIRLANKLEVP